MAKEAILFLIFLFSVFFSATSQQQLSPSQSNTLLRLPRLLEYPAELSPFFTNQHSLCSIPSSPSLSLTCSSNQVTSLTIVSNRSSPISTIFSADSFVTTLTRLPSLSSLTLVSLGLWGNLPSKLHRLRSLTYINISSNFFNGAVPNLLPLSSLQVLDISSNRFGPDLPLLNTSNLVTLVLKNNSFYASVSLRFKSSIKLQKIDFSHNKLAGIVPDYLFSLPQIQYIDLSHNKFTGTLPKSLSCGEKLRFVGLENNLLVGALPACIASNSSGLVVLDSGNCISSGDPKYQRKNSYCNQGALAAVLPPVGKPSNGSKSKIGLIIGITGGVVGAALILGLLLLVFVKRAHGSEDFEKQIYRKTVNWKDPGKIAPRTPLDSRNMSPSVRIGTIGLTPYRFFTTEELEEATNFFDHSNLISEGPQGQFYKGWLRNGSAIVIRCLKMKQKYNSKSLVHYMDVVSKIRHQHLVSIIGHCMVTSPDNPNVTDMIYLVFEHVANGTLRSHLTEWRKREMLKWPQRVTAVIGVARGIQFLHTFTVPGIVNNDLKIENILLDETLTAKISNYNLPMLPKGKNNKVGCESPFSGMDDGDLGSIQNLEKGEKEDVYQLGLILLEIITGKPTESQTELKSLKSQLQKALNADPTKLRELADSAIRNTFAYDSLRTVIDVTLNCLSEDHQQRPSVDDVLWNLQYSIQIQDGWAISENLSSQS